MNISQIKNFISSCGIREKYSIYCPGCGGTRALVALLNGDLYQSLYYNPVVVVLIIEIVIVGATLVYEYYTNKKNKFLKGRILINWILLITIIFNFVIKNFMLIILDIDLLGDFAVVF